VCTVNSGASPEAESSVHLSWLTSTLNSSTKQRADSNTSSSSPKWSPKQQQRSVSSSTRGRVTARAGQPLSELEARQLELQRREISYKVSGALKQCLTSSSQQQCYSSAEPVLYATLMLSIFKATAVTLNQLMLPL
jgi:hypothetical protein